MLHKPNLLSVSHQPKLLMSVTEPGDVGESEVDEAGAAVQRLVVVLVGTGDPIIPVLEGDTDLIPIILS